MSKPHLLFLAHRLPYPPNKGDKIRSFHLLRHLAKNYQIHLGCFVDDDNDWQYQHELRRWCSSCCLLPLSRTTLYRRTLASLVTRQPFSAACYFDRRLAAWVDQVYQQKKPSRVLAFSSAMGIYLSRPAVAGCVKVVDFVDLDSEKWRAYAGQHAWPLSGLYRRETRLLLAFEQSLAERADHSLFITPEELALFFERSPNLSQAARRRCSALANGVDLTHFSPDFSSPSPYAEIADIKGPVVVFTGAMDYQPNVDAVCWFVEHALPGLRRRVPTAHFAIVGRAPTREVLALAEKPGVLVTGSVADTRDYLAHASVAVAPLRVARGIQNKVLEAMAMGIPVLATSDALCGIDQDQQLQALRADTPQQFIDKLANLLTQQTVAAQPARRAQGELGLNWVRKHFSWTHHLQQLERVFQQ